MTTAGGKIRLATVWLGGCSGCHMSFLDLGEHLLELANRAEIVYGPLVDAKEYPAEVDVILVEGAVTNTDDLRKLRKIRERTRIVISLGDCAVTGNVTSLRNFYTVDEIFAEAYGRGPGSSPHGAEADETLPRLLPKAYPLHHMLPVDGFIPGCPPEVERIWTAVTALLEGREVRLEAKDRSFG